MSKKERTRRFGCHSTDKNVVARATLKEVRIAPRKCRLVLNMIKGKEIDPALSILKHSPKKAARLIEKLLQSAVANASVDKSIDVDDLLITGGSVDMGKTLKRIMPRAQGRATPIRKKSSHITIILGEKS